MMLFLSLYMLFSPVAATQAPAASRQVSGTVVDTAGAPLVADIHRDTPNGPVLVTTDPDGHFTVSLDTETRRLVATSDGYISTTVDAPARASTGDAALRFVLTSQVRVEETIRVTGTGVRPPPDHAALDRTVVTSQDLYTNPALSLDDILRFTPGFTLFRRSSSRAANPTTQGVTLRGLSASGASRTLVLADDVPLNDPFGGWVYWSRLPEVVIEQVSVTRGAASDRYGADAMGGVIQVASLSSGTGAVGLVEGGSLDTSRVSIMGMRSLARVDFVAAAERLSTDGAVIVARDERGPIDTPAGVRHYSLWGGLDARIANDTSVRVRGQGFSEARTNGTPLQTNDTNQRQVAASATGGVFGGRWRAGGYATHQTYDQSFSAVTGDRRGESLTQRQRVPSDTSRVHAAWTREWTILSSLSVGGEFRRVDGATTETRFVGGVAQTPTTAGARQETSAGFVQASIDRRTFTIAGGARVDRWENAGDNGAPARTETPVSGRVTGWWQVAEPLFVRGAAYRGFRTPTLNELYRNFRAGDTQTLANDALEPEFLSGGEAGLAYFHGATDLRFTFFAARLEDAVTNVTLSTTPTLITRQRQNAAAVRTRGIEVEASHRLGDFSAQGNLTVTRSRFDGGELLPALDNLDVPQIPRVQGSVGLRYAHDLWPAATFQVRRIGRQFEDDRNTLDLRGATIADLLVDHSFLTQRRLNVFLAIENLFDEEVVAGRTPVTTIALPRTFRVGVRASWR